jgi:hypothetical protein
VHFVGNRLYYKITHIFISFFLVNLISVFTHRFQQEQFYEVKFYVVAQTLKNIFIFIR